MEKLRVLKGSGAAAAVITAPFYFRHEDAALLEYFHRLADASPVPMRAFSSCRKK